MQIEAFKRRNASVQEAVLALQGLRAPGEASSAPWAPRSGDAVFILSMGRSSAQVRLGTIFSAKYEPSMLSSQHCRHT